MSDMTHKLRIYNSIEHCRSFNCSLGQVPYGPLSVTIRTAIAELEAAKEQHSIDIIRLRSVVFCSLQLHKASPHHDCNTYLKCNELCLQEPASQAGGARAVSECKGCGSERQEGGSDKARGGYRVSCRLPYSYDWAGSFIGYWCST